MADDTAARSTAGRPRQQKSIRSETEFRARLAELGVTLLDSYLGSGEPHRAICSAGHDCAPRPSTVRVGHAPCRACARRDPKTAWASFRARVKELGGTVLEPEWLGIDAPHRVRCEQGHENHPRPGHVLNSGKGICRTCARQDPREAEARFRELVAEGGGTVLGTWVNNRTAVRIRCAAGHVCTSNPGSVFRGRGICRVCGGRDSEAAWAAFRARVQELGGTILEAHWKGSLTSHAVQCAEGHRTAVLPNMVQQGQGICRFCKGRAWDVFYVVQDDINDIIKFGVTSGNPRMRLGVHERDGFDHVVRLVEGLPGVVAPELERTIIAALRDAREAPVRGREYYRARALGLVLDLVDNHPAIRAAS